MQIVSHLTPKSSRSAAAARRPTPWRFIVLALVLCTAAAFVHTQVLAAQATTLTFTAPASVQVEEPIEIQMALNGAPVAGYEMLVNFNGEAAEFGGVVFGNGESLATNVEALSATELPQGVAFGFYTCNIVGCISEVDREATDEGAPASAELIGTETVRLLPLRTGLLEINFAAAKFVDINGQLLDVTLANPSLVVEVVPDAEAEVVAAASSERLAPNAAAWSLPAPQVDEDGSLTAAAIETDPDALDRTGAGRLNFSDVAEVALAWEDARRNGNPCLDAASDPASEPVSETEADAPSRGGDVNGDGCVDIADLQILAAQPGSSADAAAVQAAAGQTFTVNSTADDPDGNFSNGICATASGACTLRAAIAEANAQLGPNTVAFNIPGSGVHTIQLNSMLPTINDETGGVQIDGYTQPGSAANTDPLVSNAQIKVELRGQGRYSFQGLNVTSAGNTVRGLAIYDMHNAIRLYEDGADRNLIVGNFLGTNASGTFQAASDWGAGHGVHVVSGSSFNRIGTPDPADRNIISGNAYVGIRLDNENTNGNVIQNNIFGLTPNGNANLSNGKMCVDIQWGPSNNIVGGTDPGQRNVCSGHVYAGLDLSHMTSTSNNYLVGNYVGTNVTGNQAYPWTANGDGIIFKDDAFNNHVYENVIAGNNINGIWHKHDYTGRNYIYNNRIGVGADGSSLPNKGWGMYMRGHNFRIGPGNVFANNKKGGIYLTDNSSDGNIFTQNSFYNNGGLAVDIAPGGVNANDSGDGDSGPNQQLNSPEITQASTSQVSGTACSNCTVEIYIADVGAGEYGEGKTFVGSTKANGSGDFSLSANGLYNDQAVTALAIDGDGNTSEFGQNVAVTGSGGPAPAPTPAPTTPGNSTPPPAATPPAGPSGPAGKLETVTVNAGSAWQTVAFSQQYERPVVVCSAQYVNAAAPYVVRVNNVTAGSFDVRLQNPGDGQSPPAQTLFCLVAEEGVWTLPDGRAMEARTYTSVVTDNNSNWGGEMRGYAQSYSQPVVLGQVMSYNDPAWSVFWSRGGNKWDPASASSLFTGKQVGEDPNRTRADETVGYIVFEAGSGTLDGVDYKIALGADTVEGVPAGARTYTFAQPFAQTPTVGIVSQGAQDGGDGSWAALFGSNALRADGMDLVVDEDQLKDAERYHTTEQVNYAIFAQPLSVIWGGGAPSTPITYAADSFSRAVYNTWAIADMGDAYSMFWGNNANERFSVDGSEGHVSVSPNNGLEANLEGVLAKDVDITFRVKADQAVNNLHEVLIGARYVNAGNLYRVRLRRFQSGYVEMQAIRASNNQWSSFPKAGTFDLAAVGNGYLKVRVQITGDSPTTLRGKVWADGEAEPGGWLFSVTDSTANLQTAGAFNLRTYISGSEPAPVRFTYDDLLIQSTESDNAVVAAASIEEAVGDTPTERIPSQGSALFMPLVSNR